MGDVFVRLYFLLPVLRRHVTLVAFHCLYRLTVHTKSMYHLGWAEHLFIETFYPRIISPLLSSHLFFIKLARIQTLWIYGRIAAFLSNIASFSSSSLHTFQFSVLEQEYGFKFCFWLITTSFWLSGVSFRMTDCSSGDLGTRNIHLRSLRHNNSWHKRSRVGKYYFVESN